MTRERLNGVPLLVVGLLSWGRVFAEQTRPESPRPVPPPPVSTHPAATSVRTMSPEEKLVRHAYMKMMRYQSAAAAEAATSRGGKAEPKDYATFGITILGEGAIEEILAKPLTDLVTLRSGQVLQATARHRGEKGLLHASYALAWTRATPEGREQRGLKEWLGSNPRYHAVTRYTLYRVTARLGRQTRTYRGLALHRGRPSWPDTSLTEMVDLVTPQLTDVLREESPAIRSPWDVYIKSRSYQAMSRALRLGPARPGAPHGAEVPLGFVPGDDVVHAPPQDDCPECQICVEGECVDDQFADGTSCEGNQCKECSGGDCINRTLCTACSPSGRACDGSGSCETGPNLIPQICGQLGVSYANQRPLACSPGSCGAGIVYDITRVTHSCDSIDLAGARVTESVSNNHGCFTVNVQGGAGCTIQAGNTLSGCTDQYFGCGPPSIFPIGTCTETITQLIYVGTCLSEVHTIDITITRTASSCSGTVVRN